MLEVEKWFPEGDDVALRNSTFIRRFEPTGRPPWMRVIISEGRVKITRIGFLDVIDYVIIRIRPASRKRHHRPEALQEDTQEPMGTTTQLLLKSQRHCMSSAKKMIRKESD